MTIAISPEINEGSTGFLNIKFYDNATPPALAVPSSSTWDIRDYPSGTVMMVSAALPAGSDINVVIPATANAIISQTNPYEIRVVTVKAIFGTETYNENFQYNVKNLGFIP